MARADAELTVAVSALSTAGVLEPGVGVIRAIRAAPSFSGRIVGLSYNPLDPAHYAPDLVDRSFLIPEPALGSERLLERLTAIHARDRIDVIIPTLDTEVQLYLNIREALRELGIALYLPSREAFQRRAKVNLPELCRRAGVKTPRTRAVYGFDAAMEAAGRFGFPFMLKGQNFGSITISTMEQLQPHLQSFVTHGGFPVLLQEIVCGNEFDVVALAGPEGDLIGAVPMKKLQIDTLGKAWGAVAVQNPALEQLTGRVMGALDWRGPLELEVMIEEPSGDPYLIEVNPRFPSWVYLSAAAGQNLPWALVELALEREVRPFASYQVGAMILRQCIDIACPMGNFQSLVTAGVSTPGEVRDLGLPRADRIAIERIDENQEQV